MADWTGIVMGTTDPSKTASKNVSVIKKIMGVETSTFVDSTSAFVSTWKTDNEGTSNDNQITLPLINSNDSSYNFSVDWGDGTSTNNISTWNDPNTTHTYDDSTGEYEVTIRGICTGWCFNDGGDCLKITNISSWGPLNVGNGPGYYPYSGAYFHGCRNLTITATDLLDLTGTTNLSWMFAFCDEIASIPNLNNWDISNVTNIARMFYFCPLFDQDISGWDVSNVTDISWMFYHAEVFNQDLNIWDTSSVTNMSFIFGYAILFNQDLSGWNTSSVTNMSSMFKWAAVFNQDISGWDTTSVMHTDYMFNQAEDFNQDIGGWKLSSLTSMSYMFQVAKVFNQDISGWDVSNVTDMEGAFYGAYAFNQDISSWDVSNVTNMDQMFHNIYSPFNQDLSSWDITSVTTMIEMFYGVDTLSTTNYSNILIGWEAQSVKDDVTFHGGDSLYSAGAAATARQALIDDHNWVITDGGEA